MGNDTR